MCQAFEPATSTQDKSLSTVGLPTRPTRRRAARGPLCVDGGSIASLFLSLFFFPLMYTLSLSFSQSQFLPLRLLPPPPPYLLLLILRLLRLSPLFSLIARLFLSFTFFFFFFITSPLIFPSFTLLLTNQGRDRATRIYIYTRFLFPCLSHRREVFLHASLFKVTTFLLHPREARSFTRHPFSKCRAAVWRARERIEER